MHPNAVLLQKLYTSLDKHDAQGMAECYHDKAVFRDIAFKLEGKERITAMWQMICEGRSKVRARVESVAADDQSGHVRVVDDYIFFAKETTPEKEGHPVHNVIDSTFRFQDGLIIRHDDDCDAHAWARMAIGGPLGFLAGWLRPLRSYKANKKLDAFIGKRKGAGKTQSV